MGLRHEGFHHREVLDPSGQKVGTVTDVLYDDGELHPAWLVVKPGFMKAEHYVPTDGATAEGDHHVVIAYDTETVKTSPKASGDHSLSTAARSVLRDHYHLAHR